MTTGTTAGSAPRDTPGADEPRLEGVVRSSRVMALGTIVSRGTGFLRTVVIATALGYTGVADAYNIANTVPNIIYELLLGGVLSSVVVPLLVQAARRDGDDGEAYGQRLLTLVTAVLTVATVVAVVAAPLIADAYAGSHDHATLALTTTFARFFLPQILFYGVGAVVGAILNVRGIFAPPMWTPVLNNLVVIGTGLLFIVVSRGTPHAGHLPTHQELILAVGTTLGIVVQTVALVPALRRCGFRLRPRWDLRHTGLGQAARLGGWVLLYVVANQVGFAVIVRIAGAISDGAFSAYTYAFFLVSLPHAIVAVSVITALLPRMSASAVEGRLDRVAEDLAGGLKLAGVILVPAELFCLALGPLIGTVVFDYVHIQLSDARLIGLVLAGYAVSLVPFSAFQLQLRAFYATHDTRTPALVNIGLTAVNVLVDVVLYFTLNGDARVVGLAVGYSASYVVGWAVFSAILRRRLGHPHRPTYLARTYVRLATAAAAAVGAGWLVAHLLTGALGQGRLGAGCAVLAALVVGTPVYLLVAERMRVGEVRQLLGVARARLH